MKSVPRCHIRYRKERDESKQDNELATEYSHSYGVGDLYEL